MKNLLILMLSSFIIFSCSDDDDRGDINPNEGFVSLELTKEFLLNEKWFIENIQSDEPYDLDNDGESSTDLLEQVAFCDLDSFYIFEQISEGLVTLNDGNGACPDFQDRYIIVNYGFDFMSAEFGIVSIDPPGQLLGGIPRTTQFLNSEFLLSEDTSFKIFRSNIEIQDDLGNDILITYTLRADADNRP